MEEKWKVYNHAIMQSSRRNDVMRIVLEAADWLVMDRLF
jgi:hypothetical protein